MGFHTELYKFVVDAVKEGLITVASVEKKGKYIGKYIHWPSISYRKNGLPSLLEDYSNSPVDYTSVFYGWGVRLVDPANLKSFANLFKFIDSHDNIKKRLLPPHLLKEIKTDIDEAKASINLLEVTTYNLSVTLINRYIHITKNYEFDDAIFGDIYQEYFASLFEEQLVIDICIPILFVKFDFDSFDLTPTVSIEKMTDDFQQARYSIKSYGPGVHESVLASATHMLRLKRWQFPNECQHVLHSYVTDISMYPLDLIDRFFASMRIKSGITTGYAQVLMRPLGWAKDYQAYLPSLYGSSLRAYPYIFENYYWINDEIPEISIKDIKAIGELYEKISNVEHNNLLIAIDRLNRCYLRENHEDSVLDATIGLEALLGDKDRHEMTHKIALRAAAVLTLYPVNNTDTYQVFRDVKKIYNYRSKVVHGKVKKDTKREIKPHHLTTSPESNLAVTYLRKLLEVILHNDEYAKPEQIDKKLLLGNLEE